jgi:hypothetical protein
MYVYIIKQSEFYKIGRTCNLEMRRAALQCSTPTKIDLIAYVETDELCALEKILHKKYKKYNSSGEWFLLPQDVLIEITEEYNFKVYEKTDEKSKSLMVENDSLKERLNLIGSYVDIINGYKLLIDTEIDPSKKTLYESAVKTYLLLIKINFS